jgi:hypothetical protein
MKHSSVNSEAVRDDRGHVLERIASKPAARLRDVAATVDITERTVTAIVNDVEEAATRPRRAPAATTAPRCSGDAYV